MPVRSPPHTSSLDGVPCRGHPLGQARATRRRQVSWLTGHHTMHGLPRPADLRPAQWLPLPVKEEAICIALAAYSCRDSLGFRQRTTFTAFPIKPLSGHRRDHAGLLAWNRSAMTVYIRGNHRATGRRYDRNGTDGEPAPRNECRKLGSAESVANGRDWGKLPRANDTRNEDASFVWRTLNGGFRQNLLFARAKQSYSNIP